VPQGAAEALGRKHALVGTQTVSSNLIAGGISLETTSNV
jgi:hypothetical protein